MPHALRASSASDYLPPERALIKRFHDEPAIGYNELLDRYTQTLLRMIRRFMHDPDDVMEVYTAVCERLRAHDFRALRAFRENREILPWLSVVAANAARDRLRKSRATSIPNSVIAKLDAFEKLVFRYYYRQCLPHEDIAEIIKNNDGFPCTPLDVMQAIGKINELLSINKRWHLLVALNANRPSISLDELEEAGFNPSFAEREEGPGEDGLRNRVHIDRLNRALEQLDSEDRLLVLLRYEHGMNAPQIADVMHYENPKYVYTRLRTVVANLRRLLSED